MDNYMFDDITASVKSLCGQYPSGECSGPGISHSRKSPYNDESSSNLLVLHSVTDTSTIMTDLNALKTKASKNRRILSCRQEIDLRYIEQLIDTEQTAALSPSLKYAVEHLIDGKRTLPEIVEFLQKNLTQNGLAFFADNHKISCVFAVPRSQEIYACFNRYRRS